jgi:acyl-CoA synthetase (AMP-forming)/AMP-acid ligase II
MISVGGMKFFPGEVESVLESHPAIHAACVFGVKEKQWGEAPVADLVLEEGNAAPAEDDLRAYCRQYLASYKIPACFRWVEQLRYTASGKKIGSPEKLRHC